MKYILILIFVIFDVALLFSQPKLYIDKENIIKTDTIFPTEYEKYIKIYNKGNEDLVISSLGASCGCTSFVLSKDTIAPQDSSELYIKINLATAEGNKQYNVYFQSNDTLIPKTALVLNLFVYRDLISDPKKLPSYSNVESNSSLIYKIKLQNSSDNEIRIQYPISEDSTKFEVLSIIPQDFVIPSRSSMEYEIKIKLKDRKFILSKLLIPTNSISVPKLEYIVMVNTK